MRIPEILLIEDSKDDRDLFRAAVQASGLRATVVTAADALEAVARLNRLGKDPDAVLPDLIVLDLGLPGLQGHTLLQVIRTAYGQHEVGIIVLTGSERPTDRAVCETWNISAYKVKPHEHADLVRWVGDLQRFLPQPDGTRASQRRGAFCWSDLSKG
jgi:CheY-like chemotaxis protein